MKVRDLISSLLDYDMDAEVNIEIETRENNEFISDFELVEQITMTVQKYVNLIVKPYGQVLVDETDYKNLLEDKDVLEDKVANLEIGMEELEQQIYELEEQK